MHNLKKKEEENSGGNMSDPLSDLCHLYHLYHMSVLIMSPQCHSNDDTRAEQGIKSRPYVHSLFSSKYIIQQIAWVCQQWPDLSTRIQRYLINITDKKTDKL